MEENGRGTELRGVVTDFVPNKRMAFHLEGDFNIVDVTFTLESHDGITRLSQDAEVRFKGLLRVFSLIFSPLFKKKIMKQSRIEFTRLKELCEMGNKA